MPKTYDIKYYWCAGQLALQSQLSPPERPLLLTHDPPWPTALSKIFNVLLLTLDSPLAAQVIDDPAGSKLLLVMEFMEGGPVLTRYASQG